MTVIQSVAQTVAWLPSLPSLSREQASLRQALTARQLDVIQLRETLRHLTQAARLNEATTGAGVVASILGRSLLPTEHAILLNRGQRDGLMSEAILVDRHGLVGRILQVHAATSTAILLTDSTHRVAGLLSRSREAGLVIGTGGTLLEFIYLDLDAEIQAGDEVVTAGIGGPFPKGIPIGTIVRIERDERQASTKAWIRPAVKLRQLEEVLCLPPATSGTARED
ncbi:MAG: rod shape-determining protein MreC [Candidatus Omnitrophica bacterium]|nr:rod shape-determining protein MreC [Candidatus Omnitrophota bacterium]